MKYVLTTLVLALSLHTLAFAGDDFELSCDGSGFESPMTITHKGSETSGDVYWDVGPDIAGAAYKHLEIVSLQRDEKTSTLLSLKVERAGHASGFEVSLKATTKGGLSGHFSIRSNDGDGLENHGYISCTYKNI